MKKWIKGSSIGLLIAVIASTALTLGYFIFVESNQLTKELIQSTGEYYNWFIFMFVYSVIILGLLGIIIGGLIGYFSSKKK